MNVGFGGYMSPEFIYSARTNRPGYGMYLRDCCNVLKKMGACYESSFHYSDDGVERDPTAAAKAEALNNRIAGYAFVTTVEGMKYALAVTGPALVCMAVYNGSGTKIWRPNGKLTGWHAMTLVGYNEQGFIVRNSWGTWWGDSGHEIIPFEDFGFLAERYALWDDPTSVKLGALSVDNVLPRGSAVISDDESFAGNLVTVTQTNNKLDKSNRYYSIVMNDKGAAICIAPRTRITVFADPEMKGDRNIFMNVSTTENQVVKLTDGWRNRISSCRIDTPKQDEDRKVSMTVTACATGTNSTRVDITPECFRRLLLSGARTSRYITFDGQCHQILGMNTSFLLIFPKKDVPKKSFDVLVHLS
jgi:hypothetical protein